MKQAQNHPKTDFDDSSCEYSDSSYSDSDSDEMPNNNNEEIKETEKTHSKYFDSCDLFDYRMKKLKIYTDWLLNNDASHPEFMRIYKEAEALRKRAEKDIKFQEDYLNKCSEGVIFDSESSDE